MADPTGPMYFPEKPKKVKLAVEVFNVQLNVAEVPGLHGVLSVKVFARNWDEAQEVARRLVEQRWWLVDP